MKETRPIIVRTAADPLRDDPQLERLAQLMDTLFEIPGFKWRFGLDALLGVIPGFGDAVTTLVSLYILLAAVRYRVPRITLLRMGANIAIDSIIGSVPLFGDLFDVWWKSNLKNVELLRRSTAASPQEARKARLGDWLFVAGISLFLVGMLALSLTAAYFLIKFLAAHLPG